VRKRFPDRPCVIRMVPLENMLHLVEAVKAHELKETNSYLFGQNCYILLRKNYLLKCGKRSLSSRPCVIHIIWIENCDSLHAGDNHVSVFLQSIVQRNQDFFSVGPPQTLLSLRGGASAPSTVAASVDEVVVTSRG
jgi:hypothetical protein